VWIEGETSGEVVAGSFNAQENLVVFVPSEPLPPESTIVVEIPAGGITDVSGNPVPTAIEFRFST
jgi:hypothetical protein